VKLFDTLRARLLATLILASLSPLIVAQIIAVPWFGGSIERQAQNTLETHSTVATELFAEQMRARQTQVRAVAGLLTDAERREASRIGAELAEQAEAAGIDYLLFVDTKNVVRASTADEVGFTLTSEDVKEAARADEPTAHAQILPPGELVALGAADTYKIEVKETKGGTADEREEAGALSVVAVAPVKNASGKRVGAIVGVDVLKTDNTFVDGVVAKVGGVSTLFQNGVRVATTVKNDQGERAIGTVVSDEVRAVVLATGEPYRGEAFVVNKPYLTAYDPIRDSAGNVIGMLFVGLDQAPYAAEQRNFALGMGALLALAAVLAVILGTFASAQLSQPIRAVNAAAEQIAAGDLTVTVPEEGFAEARAMGRAFNSMIGTLRDLIGRVGTSTHKLESVSADIASAAAMEADGATAQASAVAEATATIAELDRSFAAVADGASRVVGIAEDSLEVADKGREAVETGTESVNRLAASAERVNEAVTELSQVAEDIGQVTFVIGSIAEQTKILALNAAIEAARAGEVGKGFGVVASEVRNLADSVSASVVRIEQLVRAIQDSTRELAVNAERQVALGAETGDDVMRTRDAFDEIYERMNRTAGAAREIAAAANEQQSAARQIVDVMHQVSEGVAGTASSARQLAAAAGDVSTEAESLQSGLRGFKSS